ncbi:hypothetical protein DL98DRAFT_518711 [Cadophora sp. DSE1049]|nr:hypothetical protein DL98DRAFT_518711 [Cadophora sp. DSE1049]
MSGIPPPHSYHQGGVNNQGNNNARPPPGPPHVMYNQLPPQFYGSALPAHIPYGGYGSHPGGPPRYGHGLMTYAQMQAQAQAATHGTPPAASPSISEPLKKVLTSKLSM